MNDTSERFLAAYQASLRNESIKFENTLSASEWTELFRMSEVHHVLPMVYDAVYRDADLSNEDIRHLFAGVKHRMLQTVTMQTMRTASFLHLYSFLGKQDIHPLVVKGIICRNLYPNPDYRMSGDEDLWIDESSFGNCHEALLKYGMKPADPEMNIMEEFEVPYGKEGTSLYIEVHKHLFPPKSEAYSDFNKYFVDAMKRAVDVHADGKTIRTLSPTDHLFYLICHAFKHFLHSGFGLRQVSDMALFANVYGNEIDWDDVLEKCRAIHADQFAAALFQIGQKYLTFDSVKACYPAAWSAIKVDEGMLLEDLLESGVFGDSSMSRKHSSNITLGAVAAQKSGGKSGSGLVHSLFPSASALEGKYTYLKKHKWLLPAAWISRIWSYRKEKKRTGNDSALESLKIGEERKTLLKKYGIID